MGSTSNKKNERLRNEIVSIENRLKELEAKFDRLYDDRLEGYISDNKFKDLAMKCETEQDNLNARLAELTAQVDEQEDAELNVDRFVETIHHYAEVKELDREILNRLIDKIVVGDKVKTEFGCTQSIKIYYRFLGDLNG